MSGEQFSDEFLFRVGGILHEARMAECWGNHPFRNSRRWPSDLKDFNRQRHAGQSWIDQALAQVKALVKAGIVPPG